MKKSIFFSLALAILIAIVGFSHASEMTITGKVTDSQGDPIVGVNILVKGTQNGAISDLDGNYTIKAKKGDILVFSFIGMKRKEVKIDGTKTVINVVLEDDHVALSESVVLGYGTQADAKMMIRGISSLPLQGRLSGVSVSPSYDDMDAEEYASFSENKFHSPLQDPLSTFSIDVDAASYSNIRRMINKGDMPTHDAVRVEEMINYFSYNYPQPKGKDPVAISTEIANCPWNSKHRLVKIGLKAKEIPTDELPMSNFVFLIDVSGSMWGPTRLDLVKSSMKLLVNNLRDDDKVSIVTYASGVDEKLSSASGKDKQKIFEVLDQLQAGGGTSGAAAIERAYNLARKNFIQGGNNRIILCTDGDFNIGISSEDALVRMIEKERKDGIFLSILGYGMGNYKDKKMQALAQAGNGNHAYIDNMQEANKVLVSEFGSTMYAVAKDVKLQLEFNPDKVQAYRLVGYETRLLAAEDFNDDTKDAGEMGAGHTVTAFYEIIPIGVESNFFNVDKLKYQKNKEKLTNKGLTSPDLLTVKLRYKEIDSDKSDKIEVAIIDKGDNNPSEDFKFASAVAMFGQLLRNSDYKGHATYDDVIKLAKEGKGADENGYRSEFARLVEVTKGLDHKNIANN